MTHDLTHASFFSGVGGLDLGLERAGWRTVSFSEIDPYACAVLAERWPGVPNLGSIVDLASDGVPDSGLRGRGWRTGTDRAGDGAGGQSGIRGDSWPDTTLWTGGFPCQDLSVAGKRRGMGTHADRLDTRSGLAYAFLDLVERHRPPAIVLENVPGLLSSNGGRDLGALLGRLGELGYWWAYRVLDARHFGVPQRRRRVFIVAIHARIDPSGDGPAEVLSVGSRCERHPAAGVKEGEGAPAGPGERVATALRAGPGSAHADQSGDESRLVVRSPADAGRVRTADGMAGRLDDHGGVAGALRASDGHHGHGSPRGDGGDNLVVELAPTLTAPVVKEGGRRDKVPVVLSPTLRVGPATIRDGGPGDTVPVIVQALDTKRGGPDDNEAQAGHLIAGTLRDHVRPGSNTDHSIIGGVPGDDPLLPDGLDSHRYRCCGNGVVSDVAEWIGGRLALWLEGRL